MAQNPADQRDDMLNVIQALKPYVETLMAEGSRHALHLLVSHAQLPRLRPR